MSVERGGVNSQNNTKENRITILLEDTEATKRDCCSHPPIGQAPRTLCKEESDKGRSVPMPLGLSILLSGLRAWL